MGEHGRLVHRAARGACLAAICCMALALSGCVFSDVITEVFYDQDESYEIDYDAPKIYLNSPKAEIVSDQIPSLVPIDAGERQELESHPQFQADLSDADVRAPQEGLGEYEEDTRTDDSGANWEAGAGDQHDDSVEDVPEATFEAPPEAAESSGASSSPDEEEPPAARADASDAGNTSDVGEDNADDTDEGDTGEAADGTEGKADDGGGKTDGDQNAGNNEENPNDTSEVGKKPGATFSDTGSLDDLPADVKRVAAVGDAAIVAAVVGGADGDPNLVAVDSALKNSAAATVLAPLGFASAVECWSGNGKQGGADVQALLDLAPDAVLLLEGEASLSEDEAGTLLEAGTNIVYLPALTTHENIVQCVQRVGALLGKGGDAKAVERATAYRDYTNGLITTYEAPEDEAVCSLYVDSWADKLTYTDPYNRGIVVNAVACAPVGAASFPLSQYLATAGVQNSGNAGRYRNIKGAAARAVVWPLRGGTNDGDWTGITGVNGGLLTIDNGYTLSLTRYMNSENSGDYVDLGSAEFPAVIVKDDAIRKNMEASRDGGGLYSSVLETTDIKSDEYQVHVNPCGMFSSWTAGSIESPLEMAWAYSTFQSEVDVKGVVQGFYETFYGYTPTPAELADIVAGAYAS